MSDFEYLSRISMGQYYPTQSVIHRLNPAVKLAGFSLLILATTLCKPWQGLLLLVAATLALLVVGKISLKYALRGLLAPLPFILVLAVIQVLMASYQSDQAVWFGWGILRVNGVGLLSGGMLCLRFCALVLALTLTSATLSTLELVHGLDILLRPLNRLGLPTGQAAMVIQIMLRFIPSLALNAEKIAKSQAARGAVWGDPHGNLFQRTRQMLPLLLPLFTISLQQADALAEAMLARGYASRSTRSGLKEYGSGWREVVFMLLVLALCSAALFWPF
ncbi:MAG: energy-coupling factor transport system permease protein [Chloroflexota bacterium]|nr:energy-coupling factor transport system permease protein [Chloroflexota bacterium]